MVKRFVRFLILLFGTLYANHTVAQLSPGFSAEQTTGCAPGFIKFINESTGNPSSYFWDLGNGITSTEKNPATFYFDPGKYTVKLTVIKGVDTQTVVKDNYITINEAPVVNFTASDSTGCFPLTVRFKDSSSAGEGSIQSLQWDFGDGTFSTEKQAEHTYNVAGDFTISLKVTNSEGCTSLLSEPAYIKVLEGVTADFEFVAGLTCNPPALIQFNNSSLGKNINKFLWNFGDGSEDNSKNPLHNYTSQGTFTVSLTISNPQGCTDTVVKQNIVQVGSVKADFDAPETVCIQKSIKFNSLSSPLPISVNWNFGDGTTSKALSPTKTYSKPGTYQVTMQVNFGGCTGEMTKTITVQDAPTGKFTTSTATSTCSLPITLQFFNDEVGITDYLWDFGDGGQDSSKNPSHLYGQPGNYTVSLTVTGANGCVAKTVKPNLVYFGPPIISGFAGLPYRGCAPKNADFVANIVSPEPIVKYEWDFGDQTTSDEATPGHVYTDPGSYTVSLRITTVNGCTASFTLKDAIVLSSKPKVGFDATPREVCAFDKVFFSDSSTGTLTNWIWTFGDGGKSNSQNPVYTYKDTGYFDVRLIVTNNSCADTLRMVDFIHVKPPVAKFDPVLDCSTPNTLKFDEHSIDAKTWKWDFGDGNGSDEQQPSHVYDRSGVYTVQLEVTNGECKHATTSTVNIISESPVLEVINSSNCKNTLVKLRATGIDFSLVTSYQWNFGDGTTLSTQAPSVNYYYKKSGTYKPSLTITDKNGCKKTVQSEVAVNVQGPQAAFNVSSNTCVQKEVVLNDQSLSSPAFPVTKWIWNYGDGSVDTLTQGPFSHFYSKAGSYDIRLIITDDTGCRDSLTKKSAVVITNPLVGFTITDSLNCVMKQVNFANTSSGSQLSYKWDLGDGTTSTLRDVLHNYSKEDAYTIKLVITDTFGCQDSVIRTNGVKVANVKADMVISDTSSSCPPIILTLWNKSENYSSIIWDFSDGSFSNLETPSHYYNTPGVYKIKLIAYGYGTCADTIVKSISLKGPSGELRYKPEILCSPGIATLQAKTLNRASFIWDFGDGTTLATTDSVVKHTYVNAGKYRPKLLLEDVAGCKVPIIGKDTITIARADANIKSVATVYCDSSVVQFRDSSIASLDVITRFMWHFGDGAMDSINHNPVHIYSKAGVYPVRLSIQTSNGCVNTDSLGNRLKVVNSPIIKISGGSAVCQDIPILFKGMVMVPDTSRLTWRWNFGNGDTSSSQFPASKRYATAGKYTVNATATNSSGCDTKASMPLTVNPRPDVDAGPDNFVCIGSSLNLKPSGAATYQWNTSPTISCSNCANPVINPVVPATYYVQGTSAFGCKANDSIHVDVIKPFVMKTSFNDTLCRGQSTQLLASGSDNYAWYPSAGLNNASVSNPVARPDTTTNYRVVVSDKYKCFADTGYVQVRVYPIPVVKIFADEVTIANGDSVKLKTDYTGEVNHWRWLPYMGLNCHNCPEPMASPMSSATYAVKAWNDGGCTAEARINVSVLCNNANIFIPNTFSPNGDGANDVFYVRGKGIASVKSITIFNRWGIVVFQRNNVSINDASLGWDGTTNGGPQPSDVYVYKVDVVCNNNTPMTLKGNISLLR